LESFEETRSFFYCVYIEKVVNTKKP
jgi:hypothetical protein